MPEIGFTPEKETIIFENNAIIDEIIRNFCEINEEFKKKSGNPNYSTAVRALIIRGAKHEGIWE